MNTREQAILQHCAKDFCSLAPLKQHIPGGSLYRRVKGLLKLGWLERRGAFYRTTPAGHRHLQEAPHVRTFNLLETRYPPLQLIPTEVHRAVAILILAAVVARHYPTRPDRHPYFVLFGGTLRWKSSLGEFMCYTLGVDPTTCCFDAASESGKSLFIRRTGKGQIVFTRHALERPFLQLDEVQDADSSVRSTLKVLLRGQLTVPVENETIRIQAVPYLTLNPRPKATLEGQVNLSTPEIRRGIFANVDAIPMPDLAATGEQALDAARTQGPLSWGEPATDCAAYLATIITLVRAILREDTLERIDVHVVTQLCTAMTGFLPNPQEAIRQVVHAVGLCAETMGWTRPGWIAALVAEPRETPSENLSVEASDSIIPNAGPASLPPAFESPTLSFQGTPAPRPVASVLPTISLSTRDRLTWLAVDTGESIDHTIGTLIDLYLLNREGTNTLGIFRRTLALADQLKVAKLHVNDVRSYLANGARLDRYHCDFHDVPYALQLLDCLSALPSSWTWKDAQYVVKVMAVILQEQITPDKVATFLIRHRKLERLGCTEETLVTLLKALKKSGNTRSTWAKIVNHLVPLATQQMQIEELEETRQQKEAEVQTVQAQIQKAEDQLHQLHQQIDQATQQLDQLQGESQDKAEQLATLEGIKAFLLGRLSADDPLWEKLEHLIQMKRRGELPSEHTQQMMTGHLMMKFTEFLSQVEAEGRRAS